MWIMTKRGSYNIGKMDDRFVVKAKDYKLLQDLIHSVPLLDCPISATGLSDFPSCIVVDKDQIRRMMNYFCWSIDTSQI